jgi:hypothetical protein
MDVRDIKIQNLESRIDYLELIIKIHTFNLILIGIVFIISLLKS